MEPLAVDNGRVVFLQVDRSRKIVILIPLVSFQLAEFNAIKLIRHNLDAVDPVS